MSYPKTSIRLSLRSLWGLMIIVGKPHEGKAKSRLRHARVFISNTIFNMNKGNEEKNGHRSLKFVSQNESPDRDDKNRTRERRGHQKVKMSIIEKRIRRKKN